MKMTQDTAVSPVVGVMLMLVVTIIIAAVVSAFAGGLSGSNEKAPQVQISASYSLSDGIKINHMGGDAIGTKNTKIWVRPSKTLGSDFQSYMINASSITNGAGKPWANLSSGLAGFKTFASGDTVYVLPPYHEGPWLQPGTSVTSYFNRTDGIGATVWIEMTDKQGHLFARTEVPISS
ncbi:MAG: type IV pilin N-terminal domain-containing protein [Methanoregula sp.]|nr:type IV pilin N-terminal domain-containing protein [Methanoregula sp.]